MVFLPAFDPATTAGILERFVAAYARRAGLERVVLGLSGGVDSAVVAAVAARALGPERVLGLALPHAESDPRDAEDALLVARSLGVEVELVDVTPVVEAAASACRHAASRLSRPNLKARSRMLVLYAHANAEQRLVLGTGNKSELLQGYFTKYGDGAADLYPIGDVFKTDVWALARHYGLPDRVVAKPPSAGLVPGQTDEADLGLSYRALDEVLAAFEAGHGAPKAAEATGLDLALVRTVETRLVASEHKRTSLVVPKLGLRTPGLDWRLPRQASI